ncbi:PREDICTED: oxysterol-binding protein-related protein 8 [Hipposideros armiger]|uniref:Oxysterol-binding protein n=1 Tax=Hipposideros armiger TaxID=186990 RepID=A0A8B7SAE8_HIPAR|nr:PREDICTED: oxysterol-binding protein-related protein 8 [Hipposideros armiger]
MEAGLTDGEPDRTLILPYSEVAEVQETLLGDSKDVLGPSTVVANSDEAQLLTPGKMSQRQGKEAYPTPTKELYQASFSPASPHSQGFERGKEDISQNKDDSSLSMSKSKSESKLYNGSEKDSSASSKLTKKESLKVQKKNYREEKKRATKELLSTITDPAVIVMADWLKVSLLNDSEIERQHFKDQDMYSDKSDKENDQEHDESDNEVLGKSEESDTDTSERQDDSYIEPEPVEPLKETTYTEQSHEELGEAGEASQTETVSEENKSLIWTLLKQVRPGMDLSRVVLPTFILEPRSFLDKLSDYYYHADFLSEAALEENPYFRLKKVVKWYLSGFYKKPKGLKKPYNPILGETFRCLWIHPRTNSKTFYIAEQVSHHPPISAFYVSNRKDGFCISGSILAKSKFYGNSLSAILDGEARLTFLNRGEDYVMTMPYAHCKGILYGTMTLELGGTVNITCQKTGYSAILEFKLKPFLGSSDCVNQISGKLKLGKEVLATLEGHWDSEVFINDKKTDNSEVFWNPTPDIKQWRLIRHTVKFEEQGDFESEKLWQRVTRAINAKDQTEATQEKCVLEEAQRQAARDRKTKNEEWTCNLFELDLLTGEWHYKFADTRPWDPLNDMIQFEKDGVIQTKVKHRTPMVSVPKMKHKPTRQQKKVAKGYSSPEPDIQDSSGSEAQSVKPSTRRKKGIELGDIQNSIESIKQTQEEIKRNIMALRNHLVSSTPATDYFLQQKDYFIIFLLILLQVIINFMFK